MDIEKTQPKKKVHHSSGDMQSVNSIPNLKLPLYHQNDASSTGTKEDALYLQRINQQGQKINNQAMNQESRKEIIIEEEEDFFIVEEEVFQENLNQRKNWLLGKFICAKPIHRGSLQMALANIWCDPKGLTVTDL